MDSPGPDNKSCEFVDILKSWVPGSSSRPTPAPPSTSSSSNLSRDFWMPDESCRVCYDCDSLFTIFNRRHHCRLCGRVFCAKCTSNSIPLTTTRHPHHHYNLIRVCNFCFNQWHHEVAAVTDALTPSPSTTTLLTTSPTSTSTSTSHTPSHSPLMDNILSSPNQFPFSIDRSDDDDDEYGTYRSDPEKRLFTQTDGYYGPVEYDEIAYAFGPHEVHTNKEIIKNGDLSSSPLNEGLHSQELEGIKKHGEVEGHCNVDGCAASSIYGADDTNTEPVDFENNGVLWLPPEPEDEEDEREAVLFDDDDDDDVIGEWSYLRSSSSFGNGDYCNKDRSGEEHKKAMKNVVDEHFRALIAQLLQVENLAFGEDDHNESWLEIITSLSWEAATLLKPDTSNSGGMDPGGYVKVKCLACGRPSESMVVRGVVCKKNVAHRRMTSKIVKPRFLILGGALEYQRVSNHLSSFDTLLQQEMDHLKMAVAKIDVHHPNVLLVEKSVSRFAQEYLLAKDISLVLNIKRPLLERLARCTGAQIVPSIDHLSSQKLGYCDIFHVEKFLEEHGSAGQGGKKLMKTLMFFEGCPKPLGYTILLKGANGDELKKVKHVVQYGVFAAYHLALETSFLADEGASLPELPLKSPITVALPDKASNIGRSISTIPGFRITATTKVEGPHPSSELGPNKILSSDSSVSNPNFSTGKSDSGISPVFSEGSHSQYRGLGSNLSSASFSPSSSPGKFDSHHFGYELSSYAAFKLKNKELSEESIREKTMLDGDQAIGGNHPVTNGFEILEASNHEAKNDTVMDSNPGTSLQSDGNYYPKENGSSREEFPPSPSDHQSILVSLSTRCVWKGTVCERAHLFRIKYYGSFDKPLGRFLRDHLFDQSYRCRLCEMPSEAHVHCYTHRQGSLTISVKKLPEFLLPGEREGKIWMWHRCLRCPRTNGFPPATRRVVMSDAAWGLSFGKFLELSFSNHAAASRVASCGHSLHRDCLRFYGFGRMVACFRYASIDVHSVYLPPPKLEFNYEAQEWIQREANEVVDKAILLFTEVLNALYLMSEKKYDTGQFDSSMKIAESRRIRELEGMLQKEKSEFEESLQKALSKEVRKGQPAIDILEINRLRRQLLFHSYVWDHRLIYAASLDNSSLQEGLSRSLPKSMEKPLIVKQVEINSTSKQNTRFTSCDSLITDTKSGENLRGLGEYSNQPGLMHHEKDVGQELNHGNEGHPYLSTPENVVNQSDLLASGSVVHRALSEGKFPIVTSLSDTLDAAWTGENHSGSMTPKEDGFPLCDAAVADRIVTDAAAVKTTDLEEHSEYRGTSEVIQPFESASSIKTDAVESTSWGIPPSWVGMPFLNFYRSFNKNSSGSSPKIDTYNPMYVSMFRDLEHQGGGRLLLPLGVNDAVVPVYDDEPTSIISYALVSPDYHVQMSDELDRPKDGGESSVSFPSYDLMNLNSVHSFDETNSETLRSFTSTDESILSMSGSRSTLSLDPLLYTKALHVRVSFSDDGLLGKVKYSVTCYYAKRFEALRKTCCPSEMDFIRSLSRCKKWRAQGGKSNVFFAKSLDDRFIIKQVTKTELESFIKFAPSYFKYLSESIGTGSPTCLAKILGIYQVTSKHIKGGKEIKMDVLVMENLLFQRNVTRLYDLKGSSRSRYNPDSSGNNKVLLDQNLIEAMSTSPIFVGNKAKRLLERAVWNDTSFLASIDVMDYSLLVGVDEEKHELVLGIIDFMRQYTWDKHLETWVKASGILGGPKNEAPTVISPKQYKKRFRKAMSAYFLMVPDQWSPPTIIPSGSQSDLCEENTQGGTPPRMKPPVQCKSGINPLCLTQ